MHQGEGVRVIEEGVEIVAIEGNVVGEDDASTHIHPATGAANSGVVVDSQSAQGTTSSVDVVPAGNPSVLKVIKGVSIPDPEPDRPLDPEMAETFETMSTSQQYISFNTLTNPDPTTLPPIGHMWS
jgi:hypothetical protein